MIDDRPDFHKAGDGVHQIPEHRDGLGLGTTPAWLAPNKLSTSGFNVAYGDFSGALAWTSTGTAPALGNATITAKFKQVGKFVQYYGSLTFGSTSTYGTGSYRFSLPIAATTSAGLLGNVFMFDSSANNLGLAVASAVNTTTFSVRFPATYLGTDTAAGQTVPWTWATSDNITWNLVYEAA